MAASNSSGSLSGFVESRGLSAGTGEALPDDGGLLSRAGLEINGAGNGELADGLGGRIVHCSFETRSDDTTTTHRKTAVVVRVPEAMGYAPYLLIGGGIGPSTEAVESRRFEPAQGVVVMADKGINEGWLHELFSPAFSEWLQRSPGDFGAEYVAGTLIVARDTHITGGRRLTNMCTDAAKIAGALREEALEASEAGGGKAAAAAPKPNDLIAAKLIGELEMAGPPPTSSPPSQAVVPSPSTTAGSGGAPSS